MRSSWSPACSAKSPPASPTAVKAASAPPGSRPASRWRSSTSTTPADSNATSSRTWAPWTSSPPKTTWCSSARPAPARPTWRSAWRSGPAKPGTGSCSPPPREWVARLADAHHAGRLQAELVRLGRYPLLVIDEVGYIPFEPEAANLFFQLVSSRYERASLIVTSNKPFGRWGEVFGDDVVAAAMIDRLVHHAEVIALKGDSYRLKDRDLGRVPAATNRRMTINQPQGVNFQPAKRGQYSAVVDALTSDMRQKRASLALPGHEWLCTPSAVRTSRSLIAKHARS